MRQTLVDESTPYVMPRGHAPRLRAIELFAGVGGFRLALERAGCAVVWSNQWEPATRIQHASDCYVAHFGGEGHSNEDIGRVFDRAESGEYQIPEHDLLVGGFPCQDYSVARTLGQASGLVGKKGVLWWEIYRALRLRQPRFIFLENVDRLLKSPATQKGRDFAVMLACLAQLGYTVEWRVVNAADYGFPQRRRRVFIVGEHTAKPVVDPMEVLRDKGVLARGLPVLQDDAQLPSASLDPFKLARNLDKVSSTFGIGAKTSWFKNAGVMQDFRVWTTDVTPHYTGPWQTLGDVLQSEEEVKPSFFVPDDDLGIWKYLKGSKAEPRVHKSGFEYHYTEGAIGFPDALDKPSRTILTAEGGSSPSRFKHVITDVSGRLRRLTPVELERLNGFDDGWTGKAGAPDTRRAFLMGNALVVGIVEKIAHSLVERAEVAHTSPPRLIAERVTLYSRRRL